MANINNQYRSTDLNAPPVSGQTGAGLALLRAILVNGYGFTGVAITGITRSGTTATATCAAADILRMQTGMILTVSGAAQTDYNITATITVASTTTFTYTVANSPTTPATGTIVCAATLPITSITNVGTLATVTIANANSTLRTGEYFTIAGATGGDATLYNGSFAITVLSSTSFTYTMTGTPSGSATGTLVYSKTGLGWTNPYTTTNIDVYRPQATAITGFPQFYLRVDDSGLSTGAAKEMVATGWEVMADTVGTSGKFPTDAQIAISGTGAQGGFNWRKSSAASSTQVPWIAFGDGKYIRVIVNSDASTTAGRVPWEYGGFPSFKAGDAYNCLISGSATFNSGTPTAANCGLSGCVLLNSMTAAQSIYCARSASQVGGSVALAQGNILHSAGGGSSITTFGAAQGVLTYPHPTDSAFWAMGPVLSEKITTAFRGKPPGVYSHMHVTIPTLAEGDTVTNIANLSGVTLTAVSVVCGSTAGWYYIDTFGPWT